MAPVWTKTQAGRHEIQTRARLPGRLQRTLLLLVDGQRGEAELLAAVQGTSLSDLQALAALGLIVAAEADTPTAAAAPPTLQAATDTPPPMAAAAASAPSTDHAALTRALTALIARDLGLRGFSLTLAVEKAASVDQLRGVAEQVIATIAERKGAVHGAAAREALYGAHR